MTNNMKIHIKPIEKREIEEQQKHYIEYKDILVEDFKGQCGYCGKNREILYDKFEIDHFAPKSKFKDKENDYSNLVLACQKCNRHKGQKWPSSSADKPVVDNKGFINPATEEYNKHLARNEKGAIVPLTDIGKYMYDVLKFDIRPTSLIYKINKLYELEEALENLEDAASAEKYRKVHTMLKKVLKHLRYDKNE